LTENEIDETEHYIAARGVAWMDTGADEDDRLRWKSSRFPFSDANVVSGMNSRRRRRRRRK
jgi:hypothetical protein